MKWVVVDRPKEFRGRRIIEVSPVSSGKLSPRLSKWRVLQGWPKNRPFLGCVSMSLSPIGFIQTKALLPNPACLRGP